MVTPGTLTFWNFRSDYMCSVAKLTLVAREWPQAERYISCLHMLELSAVHFNGRPKGYECVTDIVHHRLQINISQTEFPVFNSSSALPPGFPVSRNDLTINLVSK